MHERKEKKKLKKSSTLVHTAVASAWKAGEVAGSAAILAASACRKMAGATTWSLHAVMSAGIEAMTLNLRDCLRPRSGIDFKTISQFPDD